MKIPWPGCRSCWPALAAFIALPWTAAAQVTGGPTLSIATNSPLPAATLGVSYSQIITASGGTAPYKWTYAGTLPSGLALNANTGELAGKPNLTGTFQFTVQVTDSPGNTNGKPFTLTVNPPPLLITTDALFNGTVGLPYTQTFAASGGVPPYQWSIAAGQAGTLVLDPATGVLSGTPPSPGSFNFTIQVTDHTGATKAKTYVLTVEVPRLSIVNAPSLPNGTGGTSYPALRFSAVGGTPPYSWSLLSDPVPGLGINTASGVLDGIPSTPGTFALLVQVRDNAGLSASKSFTLVINPGVLRINGTTLAGGIFGSTYAGQLTASGGTPPYSWVANGLPDGLLLDPASGAIRGIPTVPGSFAFTVRVTDALNGTVTELFRLNVALPAMPDVTISDLPDNANPAEQRQVRVQLSAPYAADLSGQLLLVFTPEAGAGDDTIQFSSGGKRVDFQIAAGGTEAVFPVGNLAFQTGTVAGTIRVTAQFQSLGTDVTAAPAPARTVRIGKAAPAITSAKVVRNSSGFQIQVTGYATSREVTQAVFRFSVASGRTLRTGAGEITLPVEDLFNKWFQDPAGTRFGSQFTFSQAFTTDGDATAVIPDSVVLTNRIGSTTATLPR